MAASKNLRALLVKPIHSTQNCVVEEVALNDDGDNAQYQHILKLIDAYGFTAIRGKGEDFKGQIAFVDDEGLLAPREGYLTCEALYPLPLAGIILITGVNGGGECVDASLSISRARELFANAYTNFEDAKRAHKQHEERFKRQHGGVYLSPVFD